MELNLDMLRSQVAGREESYHAILCEQGVSA